MSNVHTAAHPPGEIRGRSKRSNRRAASPDAILAAFPEGPDVQEAETHDVPEALAEELADSILDPEACRAAAARIPGRPDSDPVGCCEVAFAGIATLEHVIAETHGGPAAARMNAAGRRPGPDLGGGSHARNGGPLRAAEPGRRGGRGRGAVSRPGLLVAEAGGDGRGAPRREGASDAALTSLAEVFNDITNRAALAISCSGSG